MKKIADFPASKRLKEFFKKKGLAKRPFSIMPYSDRGT